MCGVSCWCLMKYCQGRPIAASLMMILCNPVVVLLHCSHNNTAIDNPPPATVSPTAVTSSSFCTLVHSPFIWYPLPLNRSWSSPVIHRFTKTHVYHLGFAQDRVLDNRRSPRRVAYLNANIYSIFPSNICFMTIG